MKMKPSDTIFKSESQNQLYSYSPHRPSIECPEIFDEPVLSDSLNVIELHV